MFLLEDVKNAGFPGLFLLLLGVMGLVLSALSISFAASRKRSAFFVGIATLALAALISFGGVLGTVYGRQMTDGALSGASVTKSQVERIRRVGYEESRSAAKLGLLFAALPLLTGAIAAFVGAGQRKDEEPKGPSFAGQASVPTPEGGGMLVPVVFLGLNILAMAGAATFFVTPLPGRAWDYKDPRWGILDGVERVLHPRPDPFRTGLDGPAENPGCAALERALASTSSGGGPLDAIEDLNEATSRCVEQRLLIAGTMETKGEKRHVLEELEKSPLVRNEEARKKVRDSLEKLSSKEAEQPSASEKSDAGTMPRELIQRIIRQHMASIRHCYEQGLKKNPNLEGTVKVRFVIGQEGSVSRAEDDGSNLADPAVVRCVVKVVQNLAFPRPAGDEVTVRYPFHFQPG